MATWEDGPEYAPRERPQSFDSPAAPPLEEAPPVEQPAAGAPVQRPRFDSPPAPAAPLAELVPVPASTRDPHLPFDVAASTLTGDSAWGSVHGGARPAPPAPAAPAPAPLPSGPYSPAALGPYAPAPAAPATGPYPAPVAGAGDGWSSVPSWPPPEQPFPAPAPPAGGPYPAPGTPQWFAPPPGYGEQPPPERVSARQVVEAATPGLCICLAVGGLVYPLAPIMVVLGLVLSGRVKAAQGPVRLVFRVAAGLLALVAFVGFFSDTALIEGWWTYVGLRALVVCWVLLVVLLALVWRGLRGPDPRAGAHPWR